MNISLIIPTFHRNEDLQSCLNSLLNQNKFPHHIMIIDNAGDAETQNICKSYPSLPIVYHHFQINSGAKARNRWIEHIASDTDIVVFIDDDTTFWPEFLSAIESFFIDHPQAMWGVAHITSPVRTIWLLKKIGFMLLTGSTSRDKQFVTQWWFNALPFVQPNKLQTVEWTSGCGMFFRKSVFDEWFRFPDKFLKYSLMEDCFLSYDIYRRYPWSLYYVPSITLIHHESPAGRIANRAKIMQNSIHRYLFVRQFELSIVGYLRTTLLLGILDLFSYQSWQVVQWYLQGLWYVRNHRKDIHTYDFDYNTFIFEQ